MTVLSVVDAAGRRRSPATLPGYHAGRPPRNKGMRYPADPPTVEEIVAVMRHMSNDRHGWRLRATVVVLWRAGLRIQEALELVEHDLDHRRGSILVRRGKGGRRREVGMDDGAGTAQAVAEHTTRAPGRAAVLHHRWPDARATVVRRCRAHRVPPARRSRWCQAPVCAAPAPARTRPRAGPRRRAAEHHPAPARPRQPRHHLDLPAGHRPRGDHRHRPHAPGTDDVRQRRSATLSDKSGSARRSRLPLTNKAPARNASTLAPVVRSESLVRREQDARISAESGSGAHRAPDAAALSAGLRLPKERP